MAPEESTSSSELQIQVHRPLTWWRATTDQLSARLRDPDRGNTPRWTSYDQDWKAIGSAVSVVADAIGAGKYSLDPNHQDIGVVHIPDTGLGSEEKKIVQAWFRDSASVTSDPWIDEWSDGRHRSWHTAQANPGIALPVRGNNIGFANSHDIPRLGPGWEKMYQDDLERLAGLKWFDRSDPLNAQFTSSLQIAASGKVPPVVLEPGQHQQSIESPELTAMRKHMAASFPQQANAVLQPPSPPSSPETEHIRPQVQQDRSPHNRGFSR